MTDLAPTPRDLEHLTKIRDACESGRKGFERKISLLSKEPRNRGLPTPRRPPQHHRHESLRVDHAPDRRVRRKEVVLPDDLPQGART